MVKDNKPEEEFKAGAVRATVWLNQAKNKAGKEVEYRTVTIERRYKDKDSNEWKSTNSFGVNDLSKAALVLNKAYEYVVLKTKNNKDEDNDEEP